MMPIFIVMIIILVFIALLSFTARHNRVAKPRIFWTGISPFIGLHIAIVYIISVYIMQYFAQNNRLARSGMI